MNIDFITYSEMDAIAESILSKAGVSTTWQGSVTKIDIDKLIEFEYNLEFEWENIDHLAQNEVVLAAIAPERKVIYMNETKKELFLEKMGTMNFSKAHELGHWILHVVKQQDYEQLTFENNEKFLCRIYSKRSPLEVQADMFAASILMPKDTICGAIKEIKAKEKVTFSDLYKLKDDFEVSISALTMRIKKLKLLYIKNREIYLDKDDAIGQYKMF